MEEENKIVLGENAEKMVKCFNCEKEVPASEAFTYQDDEEKEVYVCAECRELINEEIRKETENPNIPGAWGLGILAGALGGFLYYLITTLTHTRVGYVALGLGWLIAMGVMFGAGRKKGMKLQLISAFLTIATLLISEFMICDTMLGEAAAKYNIIVRIIGFLTSWISPMGLVIWGIGIYISYIMPKATKI